MSPHRNQPHYRSWAVLIAGAWALLVLVPPLIPGVVQWVLGMVALAALFCVVMPIIICVLADILTEQEWRRTASFTRLVRVQCAETVRPMGLRLGRVGRSYVQMLRSSLPVSPWSDEEKQRRRREEGLSDETQ